MNRVSCKLLMLLVCFLMVDCRIALAANVTLTIENIALNRDSGNIAITGKVTLTEAKRPVTLQIYQDANLDFDGIAEVDYSEKINRADQVNTDMNGNYVFEFKMRDDSQSGVYNVRINTQGTSSAVVKTFEYYNPADVDGAFAAINGATTQTAMKSAMESSIYALGLFDLFSTMFEALPQANKDNVYYQTLKEKPDGGFSSVGQLEKVCRRAAVVEMIKTSNQQTVLVLIDSYYDILDTGAPNAMDSYENRLDQSQRNAVAAALSGAAQFEDAQGFWDKFNQNVILKLLSKVMVWGDVYNLLDQHREILQDVSPSMKFDGYAALSSNNQYKVCNLVLESKNTITTLTQLNGLFNRAVDDANSNNGSGGGTGGGGGSTGGGSSSVGGTAAVTMAIETDGTVSNGTISNDTSTDKPIFSDIDSAAWAQESVYAMASMGIVNGYEDGTFRPNETVTREQLIKILVVSFGQTEDNQAQAFDDTDGDAWYFPYVIAARAMGITNGIGENIFGVGRPITRAEMAAMLYRSMVINGAHLPEHLVQSEFADADEIPDFAREAVAVLADIGVINGKGDNRFAPNDITTRAEAAKMVYAVISLLK